MQRTFPHGTHNEIPDHYPWTMLPRKGLEVPQFVGSSNGFPCGYIDSFSNDFMTLMPHPTSQLQ